ncbi:MAG: formate dehydrogenase subunit delta [Deltaproteobacteria bacterium]|nr:formate dehydrogenase subunit delta [Deltaproteobacteria bacterium]MBK8240435.1 formate dehydrogenase subunit delta [Deltaproteobacteria bacterium]MBK8718289.1 formate dehydrogenase subunit delta [Deltaproteobacteria bacterium]MBP7292113.1 formate dehydrogenase subunit delta [Nannocystaceae bacterium]
MNTDKLVHMANQIGAFFEGDPDREAALDGVAGHLRRFWDPRMRRELLSCIDAGGAESLAPLVREAIARRRQLIDPPPS